MHMFHTPESYGAMSCSLYMRVEYTMRVYLLLFILCNGVMHSGGIDSIRH